MKKFLGVVAALVLILAAGTASAQTATVNVTATVSNHASLTVTGGPVGFPDSDPDSVPSIVSPNPITVTARVKAGSGAGVTLTVAANHQLETVGGDAIPLAAVTWTTDNSAQFADGSPALAPGFTLGNWTGSGLRNAIMTFQLANSWGYAVGAYSMTLTYTLAVA